MATPGRNHGIAGQAHPAARLLARVGIQASRQLLHDYYIDGGSIFIQTISGEGIARTLSMSAITRSRSSVVTP